MKNVWKAEILQMAESDTFYVKCGFDHDGAVDERMRPSFV